MLELTVAVVSKAPVNAGVSPNVPLLYVYVKLGFKSPYVFDLFSAVTIISFVVTVKVALTYFNI